MAQNIASAIDDLRLQSVPNTIDELPEIRGPLTAFNSITNGLADVWAFISILSIFHIFTLANRDDAVFRLLMKILDVYAFIMEKEVLSKIRSILLEICLRPVLNVIPNVHSLFHEAPVEHLDVVYWCDGILGQDILIARSASLQEIQYCNPLREPTHEFRIVYFTIFLDGITSKWESQDMTGTSRTKVWDFCLCTTPSPLHIRVNSDHIQACTSGICKKSAMNRVMVPSFGSWSGLKPLPEKQHGSYKVINTLNDTHCMTTPQFATIIEAVLPGQG
ncbi:uncharacterized protein EDB91DRAFT_1338137 [Suillus paluster]|uniref:uncharacterized protein n=1 Tax=Suillus paluster TaxID=48578 RepID=UPI001B86A952|nr:uncharacterized protein EDB91DRAFT_1338137 [Suillus paluster]KAG1733390.1 hypothetical protein EDB91DRAFT_1338137 [Suillus paluster]